MSLAFPTFVLVQLFNILRPQNYEEAIINSSAQTRFIPGEDPSIIWLLTGEKRKFSLNTLGVIFEVLNFRQGVQRIQRLIHGIAESTTNFEI